MSQAFPKSVKRSADKNTRIAIVAARFNSHIVDELLRGCTRQLNRLGVGDRQIAVHHVPGAFELALAAQWLGKSKKFDAVICLGCVIRGDTPHFDYVAGECARGIARVSLDLSLPVIFGVLTTNDEAQAKARVGGEHGHAGERAADAAIEMITLRRQITPKAK